MLMAGLISILTIICMGWLVWDINGQRYDEYNDPANSSDYIGDGLYACPNCNWTGYVGLMVIVDGGFIVNDDHYCPVCGHEIDVRGE